MAKRNRSQAIDVPNTTSDGGMFSAASFAGVVSKYDVAQWKEPETLPMSSPPVIAFYGFRGGAGRTTALAHVAALMASRQVKVVAIDLDVEAPGLHRVLACPEPEEDTGTVALLREAALADDSEELLLTPHVLKSGLDVGAPIRVLPAGLLTEKFLERLEDLGVPLWHVFEGPSPLQMLINRVRDELTPQLICLDCRTGLSGLSASAMFHVADVVVCFLPVTEQSFDGLAVFLRGIKAAKLNRVGLPEVLIVPSMVPEGPDGRTRLTEWMLPKIESLYLTTVLGIQPDDESSDFEVEQVPLVREGIEYRRGIALADHIRTDFAQLAGGIYEPLMRQLNPLLGIDKPTQHIAIDAQVVLAELVEKADLKNLAFAESTRPEDIVTKFIEPSDFKALVDRSTWYIVGAKGAGKTWLWTYLQSEAGNSKSAEMSFIAGHGPGEELLSANALQELERDKKLKMRQNNTYGALWLLYASKRLFDRYPNLAERVVGHFRGVEKKHVSALATTDPNSLQETLLEILPYERASTLAERLLRAIDEELLTAGLPAVTLLFDGLDVGFGSDEQSITLRSMHVNALVETTEALRGTSKRVFFKIFLREDIHGELTIQNQSHLSAATLELRWEPRDLWMLALNLVSASSSYLKVIRGIDPTVEPSSWPPTDERRQQLLVPLWGAQMEGGNKASTAVFVQRRMADGKGRLFPRTLVQLLAGAIEHQRKTDVRTDRVLRSASVQAGYREASVKRVEDLRKEYDALGNYLNALKGMTPTGTEKQICEYIQKRLGLARSKAGKKTRKKGAEAGALHAGPRGWHGVIERLLEVGVLREYKRARGDNNELKYEISLLYRPGLGIRAYGA